MIKKITFPLHLGSELDCLLPHSKRFWSQSLILDGACRSTACWTESHWWKVIWGGGVYKHGMFLEWWKHQTVGGELPWDIKLVLLLTFESTWKRCENHYFVPFKPACIQTRSDYWLNCKLPLLWNACFLIKRSPWQWVDKLVVFPFLGVINDQLPRALCYANKGI